MSEGLEKLRSIGAQKIHEQTHIAHKYVQDILHESFEGMQKVQLLGFISILEREYDVDLASLRESAVTYFESLEASLPKEEASYKKELLSSSKPDRKKLYIIAAAIVLVAVVMIFFLLKQEEHPAANKETKQGGSSQVTAPAKLIQTQEDNESNETIQKEQNKAASKPKPAVHHTLSIIPRTKVWLGIIDLDSGKKRQTVTSHSVELNASKSYLLTFGHGYIDIAVDGNKTSFKDPKGIKFLYKNGEIKKIGNAEFRRYNKGKLW